MKWPWSRPRPPADIVPQARSSATPEGALIPLALAQLSAQLTERGSIDSKAFGALGAQFAVVALGVATRPAWTPWFLVGLVGIAISVVLLVTALWPHETNTGPSLGQLSDQLRGESAEVVDQVLLRLLLAALADNTPRLEFRGAFLRWGLVVGVFGVAASAAMFVIVDSGVRGL